jgi:hypothetical protein
MERIAPIDGMRRLKTIREIAGGDDDEDEDDDDRYKEPGFGQLMKDYCHPAGLFPDALINASTGLVNATSFVFALLINDLVKQAVDESSHHDMAAAVGISFGVYLLASYIGSFMIQVGKKMKYDLRKKLHIHRYKFDS